MRFFLALRTNVWWYSSWYGHSEKIISNCNFIISLTSKGTGQTTVFFSVVMLSVFFQRVWPSWIIRYSWLCWPCMRCEMSVHQKNGGELMNIRCDFFHPIPSSSCSTCGQFVRNSEMPLATLNFLETKITWKDCYLKWKKCQQIRSPILKG